MYNQLSIIELTHNKPRKVSLLSFLLNTNTILFLLAVPALNMQRQVHIFKTDIQKVQEGSLQLKKSLRTIRHIFSGIK